MKAIKWILTAIAIILAGAFLHYNLPDRDIVQVVGTFEIRDDKPSDAFGAGSPDAGSKKFPNRDVRYITTERTNGKPMVYANQDTGWGWPPYFKFDTSNLTAEAQALARQDDVQWVAVRHYGWRIEMFSIYPNATSFKKVDGPDVRLIPWFNIVFLSILAFCLFSILRFFGGLKRKHVDPKVDAAADSVRDFSDKVEAEVNETKSNAGSFMKRWIGSSKD